MFQFGVSIILVFIGLRLIRGTSQRSRRIYPEKNQSQEILRLTGNLALATQRSQQWYEENQRLVQQVRTLRENQELSDQVAQDAIHREVRAKEALRAVLRKNQCTPEQIERVLNAVDGESVK